jgi:chemotaxis protein CheD
VLRLAGTKERVVGISEFAVSSNPTDVLVTHSLGSCIGLVLHDPVACVGGLLHSMMPTSSSNPDKAAEIPAMYTDTGSALLIQSLYDMGATKCNLVARVVGAASHLDTNGIFRIGEKNYAVVRKVLWKNGILIASEDTGGSNSRTVYLEVGSGRVFVKSESTVKEL